MPDLRGRMSYFDHEKLDAYRAAIELVVLIDEIESTCREEEAISQTNFNVQVHRYHLT